MDAKELRVGNWIEKEGKKYQASALTIFCCGDKHNPIPLTKEWLIKFGFEFVNEASGWCDKNHIIYELKDGWEFHPFCTNDKHLRLIIYNVHTLQNVNFCLTGEELELKK